ncbi:hypothetical protein BDK51DRAFT_42398 [Blyttiomyces helicus]|uniref:Uncharacterized protein n=1 Tax=Blyttiomyces helicus TaxID=388810 RepID=A0A4P9W1L9_9FUNG|nr:hypothetical protein BDK51DRAFT_42398 [Blyttiomyces helicus]|eukprot:RKO84470.1 hypothetical protein BDK51DRAFT_42398 [Blyttiomyces helicus]
MTSPDWYRRESLLRTHPGLLPVPVESFPDIPGLSTNLIAVVNALVRGNRPPPLPPTLAAITPPDHIESLLRSVHNGVRSARDMWEVNHSVSPFVDSETFFRTPLPGLSYTDDYLDTVSSGPNPHHSRQGLFAFGGLSYAILKHGHLHNQSYQPAWEMQTSAPARPSFPIMSLPAPLATRQTRSPTPPSVPARESVLVSYVDFLLRTLFPPAMSETRSSNFSDTWSLAASHSACLLPSRGHTLSFLSPKAMMSGVCHRPPLPSHPRRPHLYRGGYVWTLATEAGVPINEFGGALPPSTCSGPFLPLPRSPRSRGGHERAQKRATTSPRGLVTPEFRKEGEAEEGA